MTEKFAALTVEIDSTNDDVTQANAMRSFSQILEGLDAGELDSVEAVGLFKHLFMTLPKEAASKTWVSVLSNDRIKELLALKLQPDAEFITFVKNAVLK